MRNIVRAIAVFTAAFALLGGVTLAKDAPAPAPVAKAAVTSVDAVDFTLYWY